jgi:oxygen-independent coproporphyrinogen-3 oxidase
MLAAFPVGCMLGVWVYWLLQDIEPSVMKVAPLLATELLRRYDVPGPRYTSYPTAPHFRNEFEASELVAQALAGNSDLEPRRISLYMHVPFCFSPCFYCGCNRIITRDPARGALYAERLLLEIATMAALFNPGREVIQLHMGGGTPNFLSAAHMATLIEGAHRHFHFSNAADRDFSMEIDPRFINEGDIATYASLGFNRASLGVQDFDIEVQRAVNRIQSVDQTLRVLGACRAAGFRSINIDLIYGLPKQSLLGFARTLDTVIAARPDRLAIYGYAHLPEMFKAQRQIGSKDLPDTELKLALLQLAIDKLTSAGYRYIGMDHFALPGDELSRSQDAGQLHRNFMGYTTHADTDLVGVGVSAISHIGNSFSQNPRDLTAWELAVDAGRMPVWRGMTLSEDDVIRADVIQQVMCLGAVDIEATSRRHSIDFARYFAASIEKLEQLIDDELVVVRNGQIKATEAGRMLLRRIAMCFDKYLTPAQPGSGSRAALI